MVERRWLVSLGPPLAAALTFGLVASSSFGATDRRWDPPPCPGGPDRLAQAAADANRTDGAGRPVPDAWFTLDPVLDGGGALAGQRLRIGLGGQRASHVNLPAEASASGPFGRVVLVVADDGRRSEIRAIDRRNSCAWSLGVSNDVVRRVILDPAGTAVHEFRVDRTTRQDLGVWRRPIDGTAPQRVLGPVPDDARFGPTWSTNLGWSEDATTLAVQSCGAVNCRTRLLNTGRATVALLDEPGQGDLVGIVDGVAVTRSACHALPCPVVVTDAATGRSSTLVDAAGPATLVAGPDGPRVAAETPAGTELRDLDGRLDRTLDPPPAGRLVRSGNDATSGTGLPSGWLAWSPDGRSPDDAFITRLSDGRTVRLSEVTP